VLTDFSAFREDCKLKAVVVVEVVVEVAVEVVFVVVVEVSIEVVEEVVVVVVVLVVVILVVDGFQWFLQLVAATAMATAAGLYFADDGLWFVVLMHVKHMPCVCKLIFYRLAGTARKGTLWDSAKDNTLLPNAGGIPHEWLAADA
jgi:hypothetical protein